MVERWIENPSVNGSNPFLDKYCNCLVGGIGRRNRFKIYPFFKGIGSSPILSTFYIKLYIKFF